MGLAKVGTFLKYANDRNRNIPLFTFFQSFIKITFFSRSFCLIRALESCVYNIVRALHSWDMLWLVTHST